MKREELKEAIMSYLRTGKSLCKEALTALIAEAGDYTEELQMEELDFEIAELPSTNVGVIYIQKDFSPYVRRIDTLCDKLYALDQWAAGWEYFSTICHFIDCKWQHTL